MVRIMARDVTPNPRSLHPPGRSLALPDAHAVFAARFGRAEAAASALTGA
ncbi:MAG TPA: hypothetical protein VJP87_13030 [Candidatus Acidoferrales bacterium]|nr:hypothetical protein [Candidatus Acidoferrales bacterium]